MSNAVGWVEAQLSRGKSVRHASGVVVGAHVRSTGHDAFRVTDKLGRSYSFSTAAQAAQFAVCALGAGGAQ